jgi:myosin heavy subunit
MEKAAIVSDDPTNVFVQDPDFAWLPATVVDTDDADRVQVQIQLPSDWTQTTLLPPKAVVIDKTVRWVNLNDYFDHVLPQQNNKAVRDMAELPHLHEAGLLYQIKERHAMQQPYTRVGDILVAVNPCQWMEGLYTVEMQELYAKHFVGRHGEYWSVWNG